MVKKTRSSDTVPFCPGAFSPSSTLGLPSVAQSIFGNRSRNGGRLQTKRRIFLVSTIAQFGMQADAVSSTGQTPGALHIESQSSLTRELCRGPNERPVSARRPFPGPSTPQHRRGVLRVPPRSSFRVAGVFARATGPQGRRSRSLSPLPRGLVRPNKKGGDHLIYETGVVPCRFGLGGHFPLPSFE